jgi:catechol 2,3-dioxygenase-like lactoylglutathione lyase family enzyme
MAVTFQVTMDCADPAALAAFWAKALGYKIQDPPPGFDSWPAFLEAQGIPKDQWNSASAIVDPAGKGTRIFFQQVPEGKTVKNRQHLDLTVSDGLGAPADKRQAQVQEATERFVKLGATLVGTCDKHGEHWAVMRDPEGNEFCLQ